MKLVSCDLMAMSVSDVFKAKKNRIQRQQLDEFARKWQAADTAEIQCLLIKRQKAAVKERAKVSTLALIHYHASRNDVPASVCDRV